MHESQFSLYKCSAPTECMAVCPGLENYILSLKRINHFTFIVLIFFPGGKKNQLYFINLKCTHLKSCLWICLEPSQHIHTYLLQCIYTQLPPCPLQLLHSDDYFQHNKIWGCSGSKSWSPLVYFCDGILIHSQRLRIAVAWHRLLHLALDTELEAAPTGNESSTPRGRELERARKGPRVGLSTLPSAHYFYSTIICSWC